jgi:hypothetical protein
MAQALIKTESDLPDWVPPTASATQDNVSSPDISIPQGGRPTITVRPLSAYKSEKDLPDWTPPAPQKQNNAHDLIKQIPTGFNEVLADAIGLPVDATTWAMNKIPGVNIKTVFATRDARRGRSRKPCSSGSGGMRQSSSIGLLSVYSSSTRT